MTCETIDRQAFFCPTKWQIWRQVLALLPRGRAWQTHETNTERIVASESSQLGLYELGSTGLGTEPVVERLTVMQQYWAAFAEVLEYLHRRACALIEEFFCSTARELLPEWHVEYGHPDPCEPWRTLCDKVRATGGATCAYLAGLAASSGWVIACSDCSGVGGGARAGRMVAGADCNSPCACPANTIFIRVYLNESPSYSGRYLAPQAGLMRAGCDTACGPNIDALICLIERFKPAHVKAIYEPIGG